MVGIYSFIVNTGLANGLKSVCYEFVLQQFDKELHWKLLKEMFIQVEHEIAFRYLYTRKYQ